jgi:hypothetical protein
MNTDELYLQLVRDKDIYPDPETFGNNRFWAIGFATGAFSLAARACFASRRLRRFNPLSRGRG